MWSLLQLLMAAGEGAAHALAELAGLPLQAAERLAWEREQVAAHTRGDRAAFEALYRAYANTLYLRVLLPVLRQPALAEDALAETFARAHAKLGTAGGGERSLYFWLARIARNCALDLQRHGAVRQRSAPAVTAHFEQLQLPEPDPETALSLSREAIVARARVAQVLAQLPPRYRQAIELRFFDECSRDECAARLDLKVATFDVLLLRALRAFRKRWRGESE